jgi:hypothetical protein
MTKEEILKLYMADLNNLVADSDAKRSRIIHLEDELEALNQGQTLPIDSVSDCNMQDFMDHYQNSKHTFTDKAIDVLKSYKR